MTYCLGIVTKHGLVMACDSRTNAGFDQINVVRKMHPFVIPGDRALVIMASGSLSCTQSVITLLRREFDDGEGLAKAENMYDAARIVGAKVREVADIDREPLERDEYKFNVNLLLGGQIKGEPLDLYMIYPQGNPLQVTQEAPFLQIGETKYGRPILDRGIRYDHTSLEEACKYALLSLDSTMKSNVTVGPPIDLLAYAPDDLELLRHRRFPADDPALTKMRTRWDQALRHAISKLPDVRLTVRPKDARTPDAAANTEDTIQLVEPSTNDNAEIVQQASQKQS